MVNLLRAAASFSAEVSQKQPVLEIKLLHIYNVNLNYDLCL